MKKNIRQYLSNLGVFEEYLEMLDELGAIQHLVTPDLFLNDKLEACIESGTEIVQQLGDYEIFQITQYEGLTIFFLYKEDISEELKPDRCLALGYNNYTGEFSGVVTIPIIVEDGKYITRT